MRANRFDHIVNNGIYRSRYGVILGVCRGIAEYFNLPVFWIRIISLILLFFTFFWPTLILYIMLGLIMKPEPVIPIQTESEREFYDSYLFSGGRAIHRVKRKFDNLERRIRRMEHIVTEKEFSWKNRFE